ncbi:MAG: hypothetical protein C0485_04180 [Pirellula sp.]|nr:hypothetical protein [Pirellula sp.]
MNSPYVHERRRIMDPAKKVKFSQLVRESHSLEEAAEWLDVSIRTVQRERKRDEDFDHEVRLALQATPDPLRLMENAARTHWRAAAWLLERTRPEQYARKPANTARDYQVEAALGMLLEAALAATAPAERAAFYQQVEPVCGQALQYCFPQLGPNGNLKKSKLPPTPLTNETSRLAHREAIAASMAQAQAAAANGEQPAEWFTAPGWFNEQPAPPLSPKTHEATASDAKPAPRSHAPRGNENADDVLSPKTREATADDATAVVPEPILAIDYNLPIDFNLSHDDFAHAIAARDPNEQAVLWDQRLRHWGEFKRRREAQLSRTTRPATKRRNAA